jgi:hypothetical protein
VVDPKCAMSCCHNNCSTLSSTYYFFPFLRAMKLVSVFSHARLKTRHLREVRKYWTQFCLGVEVDDHAPSSEQQPTPPSPSRVNNTRIDDEATGTDDDLSLGLSFE